MVHVICISTRYVPLIMSQKPAMIYKILGRGLKKVALTNQIDDVLCGQILNLNRPKFPQNKGINMIIFTSSHSVLINNIFLCPTVNHFLLNPTQYLTHRICAAIELLLMMPWYLINNKLTKIYLTLNTSLLMQVNFELTVCYSVHTSI